MTRVALTLAAAGAASVAVALALRHGNATFDPAAERLLEPLQYPLYCFPVRKRAQADAPFSMAQWAELQSKMAPSRPIRSPSELLHHVVNAWVYKKYPEPEHLLGKRLYFALSLGAKEGIVAWDAGRRPLFYRDSNQLLRVARLGETGSESHPDQILAGLAELHVPLFQPVGSSSIAGAVDELVQSCAWFIQMDQELSWTLEALIRYYPSTTQWRSWDRSVWTIDRLCRSVLEAPPGSGSCHGTHQLRALAIAARAHALSPCLSEQTQRAVMTRLQWAADRLTSSQQADGSWRSDWALAVMTPAPVSANRLRTTGHHLEWLLLAPAGLTIDERSIDLAARYCVGELLAATPAQIADSICDYSHAFRAVKNWYRAALEAFGVPEFFFEGDTESG